MIYLLAKTFWKCNKWIRNQILSIFAFLIFKFDQNLQKLIKYNGSGAASMFARLRCRTGNVTMYIVTLPVTERCKGVPGGNVRKKCPYILAIPVTQRGTYLRHRLCNSVGCYVTGDRKVYIVALPVRQRLIHYVTGIIKRYILIAPVL